MIVVGGQSDSACLDNMIELLTLTGRSLPHVMMMLIPEAWDGNTQMDLVKSIYEYHASIMEPWDGLASISFTDGKIIGATLIEMDCVHQDIALQMMIELLWLPRLVCCQSIHQQ